MKKRILSLLAAVSLMLTLVCVPAAAFSDVADASTAVDIECLRLLGVLDGYADGSFRPNATLTRAQFCKMAVYAQNAQKELGKYRVVTVFPDVKPSHWAAAYINLASKGRGIILGFADGRFRPEAQLTAGQAVTILMRQLGYKDSDVGAVWPDGYLAQAEIVGLTDGLKLSGSAPLTRGQAARLFVNLLRCDKADGSSYAAGIASSTVEHTMLVSSTADISGVQEGMETTSGAVYQMANKVSNGLLNGRMGTLLLDAQGKVMTFVPDTVGSSRTVILAQAKVNALTDTYGQRFAVNSDTETYYNDKQSTWGEVYAWVKPGTTLTLYLSSSGAVEYIFAGAVGGSDQAVVVPADGSSVGLDALAGSSNYRLTKNGAPATLADLRANDVVTYSAATNTLQACDVRIDGIYEDCSPNPDAPETVTVLGHEFKVLPTATGFDTVRPGDGVTLLLTADNRVAGIAGSGVRGNALGVLQSSGEVELLCGVTVSGELTGRDTASRLAGQLVRVSSSRKGALSLTAVSGGVSGDLNVAGRKLGSVDLAPNVTVLRPNAGGLEAVALSQLSSATVAADQIRCAELDWAGRVSVLVLGDQYSTANYIYGRAVVRKSDENIQITVEYGDGKQIGPMETGFDEIRTGQYVRASVSGGTFTSILPLDRIAGVSNSAWLDRNAVTARGKTYTVADDVPCYNRTTKRWMTLDAAHAYADVCDLYVDGTNTVRAIEIS